MSNDKRSKAGDNIILKNNFLDAINDALYSGKVKDIPENNDKKNNDDNNFLEATNGILFSENEIDNNENIKKNNNENNFDVKDNSFLNFIKDDKSLINNENDISIEIKDESISNCDVITLEDKDLEFLNGDENFKISNIQIELIKNKKFIDKQISEINTLTANYDKFSKSVYEVKLEMVKERTRILESLTKMIDNSIKREKELDEAKDITDIIGKR